MSLFEACNSELELVQMFQSVDLHQLKTDYDDVIRVM